MQSRVQNITTVHYLIYTSQHSDITHSGQWTVTSLDVNVFRYVVMLFFDGVIQMSTLNAV